MREPATREGARLAGWRYGKTCPPNSSLLLRHSGLEQGRWRMVGLYDRLGFAVAALKTARKKTERGALAIWTDGRVNRFDEIRTGSQTGKTGARGQ